MIMIMIMIMIMMIMIMIVIMIMMMMMMMMIIIIIQLDHVLLDSVEWLSNGGIHFMTEFCEDGCVQDKWLSLSTVQGEWFCPVSEWVLFSCRALLCYQRRFWGQGRSYPFACLHRRC